MVLSDSAVLFWSTMFLLILCNHLVDGKELKGKNAKMTRKLSNINISIIKKNHVNKG